MRIPSLLFFLAATLLAPLVRGTEVAVPRTPSNDPVWQAQLPTFEADAYASSVEALISRFEASTGKRLVPGLKKKVGLKIYTDSGPGMATPVSRAMWACGSDSSPVTYRSAPAAMADSK